MAKATVFKPDTGERKVVDVGDPNAFAGGFVLETPTDNLQTRSATPVVDPNKSGSLENTLTTLPEQPETNLDNLRTAVRKASELAFARSGGANRGLNTAKESGLKLFNPTSINSAIEAGNSLKADIKDIYSTTLDRIMKMEDARKEGALYISQLAGEHHNFFNQLSPEEIQFIQKTGYPPMSLAVKLAAYKEANPDADKELVMNLASKYIDAGILPTDSLKDAYAKIPNSKIYQDQVKPPSSGGGSSMPDYTNTQLLKLRQKFGDDWQTTTTPQQQLDYLFGEDTGLTEEDWRDANSLGIGSWSEKAIGTLLEGFTNPADRRAFVTDFNLEQEVRGASIDPVSYMEQWAAKKDNEDEDKDVEIIKSFTEMYSKKL